MIEIFNVIIIILLFVWAEIINYAVQVSVQWGKEDTEEMCASEENAKLRRLIGINIIMIMFFVVMFFWNISMWYM